MKAAVVGAKGKLEVVEVPTPEATLGRVVVEVAYCGICGSDVHMLDAGMMPQGSVPGHELSGRIVSVGQGVEGWREGDPVVVLPIDPCFSCEPCRHGAISLCQEGVARAYGLGNLPGGFAQYMVATPAMLFRVPDTLDLMTAALNEPWAVSVHAVNLSGFQIGAHGAVIGAGPIGLLTASALKGAGAAGVYVSEPDAFRAEKAWALGVEAVLDPSVEDLGSVVAARTGRLPDYVFDCAGTASSMQEASAVAGWRGRVVLVGVPMGNATFFPLACFLKETEFRFSFGYSYREFGQCLALLARGAVRPEVVVSDVVPLREIAGAFEALHGTGHTKILVDCHGV